MGAATVTRRAEPSQATGRDVYGQSLDNVHARLVHQARRDVAVGDRVAGLLMSGCSHGEIRETLALSPEYRHISCWLHDAVSPSVRARPPPQR